MNDFDTLEGAFEDWCRHCLNDVTDKQLIKAFRSAFFAGSVGTVVLQSAGHNQTLQDELMCFAARKQ